MSNYSEEQVRDIQEREKQGLAALKELQLTPAIQMTMVNIGNDTFGIRPIPYLQDTKYGAKVSPFQPEK